MRTYPEEGDKDEEGQEIKNRMKELGVYHLKTSQKKKGWTLSRWSKRPTASERTIASPPYSRNGTQLIG